MTAPIINIAPSGIVHSCNSMYMDITVPSNSAGYYYIILKCNGANLKLVFYTVNHHIKYSFRELVLDQLAKNLLFTAATANNAVMDICDPVNTISISVQDPSETNDNLVCIFKVFRMSEPDNMTTYIPAAGTRRLMLDGRDVIYREAMSSIPFSRIQSLTGSTLGYNDFFPVFSKYNRGVNRVAKVNATTSRIMVDLMPISMSRYQLSLLVVSASSFVSDDSSVLRLYDNDLNHIEDVQLHILDDAQGITSQRLTEYIIITNEQAAYCRIDMQFISYSQLFFAEAVSQQSMFDQTFDNTFAGSNDEQPYSDNPLKSIYEGEYSGIGYTIDMNAVESIIGKQSRISDGVRTYTIKTVGICENLIWLSWINSYGMIQYMPMTGNVSITEDADRNIDYNQYDTASNRYLPATHRKDYVQAVDINTGFEPDMVAVRSLLESEFVTIHNHDFTLSARCIVTCDDMSRIYNPIEPESLKLQATLVTNNTFD